jgi:2',3'-cyclic-nucleotide 2'-phosphodiesterase (5'-nucleotidase family)
VNAFAEQNITIFYTNDVRGEIEPCGCPHNPIGGLSRKTNYIKKQKIKNFIVVDAGDIFSDASKVKIYVNSFNNIGESFINLGEKDLILGSKFLNDLSQDKNFKIISSNLFSKDKPVFKQYIIKEIDKIKFGIMGIIGESIKLDLKEFTINNPKEILREGIKFFQNNNCDYIILLAHADKKEIINILKEISDISFVILGHSGEKIDSPINVNDSFIVQSGFGGRYLGRLDLSLKNKSKKFIDISSYKKLTRDLKKLNLKIKETQNESYKNNLNQLKLNLVNKKELIENKLKADKNANLLENNIVSLDSTIGDDNEILKIIDCKR